MKIVFLGTGESLSYITTSILIEAKINILLDCGYFMPPSLWKYNNNPNFLDAIYISHLHADHYFGLAPILLTMNDSGRKKPLVIFSREGSKSTIIKSLYLAYGKIIDCLSFPISYIKVNTSNKVTFRNLSLSFTQTKHAETNYAIRITDGKHIICYSGDGAMTDSSKKLYKNSDLLIHDSYFLYKQNQIGHESVERLVEYSREANIKQIALVHINRMVSRNDIDKIKSANMFIAQNGQSLTL